MSYMINPITNRKIKIGSRRYQDLIYSGVIKEEDDIKTMPDEDSESEEEEEEEAKPLLSDEESSDSDFDDLSAEDLKKLIEYAGLLKNRKK